MVLFGFHFVAACKFTACSFDRLSAYLFLALNWLYLDYPLVIVQVDSEIFMFNQVSVIEVGDCDVIVSCLKSAV